MNYQSAGKSAGKILEFFASFADDVLENWAHPWPTPTVVR